MKRAMRAISLAGCAAVLLTLVAVAVADPAAAAMPRKVWIGGDSMAYQIRPTLDARLRAAGVVSVPWLCKSSSGLVRTDFLNWPNTARKQMRRHHPKVTVFMIGTNDGQGMTVNGRVYPFGSTGWKKYYRIRVAGVMKSMLGNGAQRVYWIGMPIMASSQFSKTMRVMNSIFRSEAKKRPAVTYIDAWKLFSSSSGRYVAKWRATDGIHFNMAGVNRLVSVVVKKVRSGR
jgi:hypothetical protein